MEARLDPDDVSDDTPINNPTTTYALVLQTMSGVGANNRRVEVLLSTSISVVVCFVEIFRAEPI
jgi:hypothetical protein